VTIVNECYSCEQNARFTDLPIFERIAVDEHWRVAHALGAAVEGWLVLVPRRHVATVAELTDAEAASLGSWQVRLSRALTQVTGCVKTYVVQFAEKEGFQHVHFHIVPRAAGLPAELRGPGIFALLRGSEAAPGRVEQISTELARALGNAG
jgi:diadenosine tetraphosphate (Ap4A) HIT family hydrolase